MTLRKQLVLSVIATDSTFQLADGRAGKVWLGKCIHCNAHLQVTAAGDMTADVTLEHILPRSHGGTDDLHNLALACARCNHLKGKRLDHLPLGDARLTRVVQKLRDKRRKRWREPADERHGA